MIDYEKLMIAHELAEKLPFPEWEINHIHGHMNNYCVLTFEDKKLIFSEEEYKNIDDLIARLKELTNTKPKYSVGQAVWLYDCNKICTAKIIKIRETEYLIEDCKSIDDYCNTGKTDALECEIYLTKEALIEDQIKYWSEMLPEKCKHDPDEHFHCKFQGKIWSTHVSGGLPAGGEQSFHCSKCGEFYT